ncbi:odorant receptor 131-2-like [Alosa pseudoharengus]|uniref:odorant receptor 131-2-like n=1 Tax=Alosa pseudoharengus TaxID=34774 RepID=UPI003F8AC751
MNVNSSQSVNGSTQGAFRGNDPVRLHVTTAVAQVIVWPFILIDLFMLLVYLRKQVLGTEARYVLFAQTLLADAIFLLLTNCGVISYYVDFVVPVAFCVPLLIVMDALAQVSPNIILAMCLERYVAVCMPLRHVDIFTPQRTVLIITIIWLLSFMRPLVDLIILLSYIAESYFYKMTSCSYEVLLQRDWHMMMRGNVYILKLVFTVLILCFSYGSIMRVARRASGDNRNAASKGQRTMLLHVLQLFFCTLEAVSPFIEARILKMRDINLFLIIRYFDFLAFHIFSRAISPLIYGFRDEKFYTALRYYACCKFNDISTHTHVPPQWQVKYLNKELQNVSK